MKHKKITNDAELYDAIYADRVGGRPRPFAELVTVDGNLRSVRIGSAVIQLGLYSTLEAVREIEHEEVERYRLIASAPGFDKQVSYFEHLSDLRAEQAKFGSGAEFDDNNGEAVKVLVNDDGTFVREVYRGEAAKCDSASGSAMTF